MYDESIITLMSTVDNLNTAMCELAKTSGVHFMMLQKSIKELEDRMTKLEFAVRYVELYKADIDTKNM